MYNGLIIYQEVYNSLHLNHECGELYQKSIVLKKVFESRLHSILHCKKKKKKLKNMLAIGIGILKVQHFTGLWSKSTYMQDLKFL